MEKITIIGANSFLAQNFYTYLNKYIGEVEYYLYDIHSNFFNNDECNYQKIDFFSTSSIEKINFDVDYIYFFIGKTGTISGFEDYEDFIKINEKVLLKTLETYCSKKSNACFIYPSTRLVYKSSLHKVKETDEKELKSIYAITKYAAENYIELFHQAYGIKYVIFRLSVPWGSLLNNDYSYGTFNIFTNQIIKNKQITIFGTGEDQKTYTHIEDICNAIHAPMKTQLLDNNIYNIGGYSYTLNEIAKFLIGKNNVNVYHVEWPKLAKVVDGGNTVLDSSKLNDIFPISYKRIEEIEL